MRRLGAVVSGRLWGLQPVHSVVATVGNLAPTADVVLCMDERVGIPAALASARTPVVTGIAWLDDLSRLHPAHRLLAAYALDRAAAVFVECAPMIDALVGCVGVPQEKVHFVTLGVDAEHFSPTPLAAAVPGRVFSVGDDCMRDYATLTAALHRVRAVHPALTAEIATTRPVCLPSEWSVLHRRRMDHAVRACYERADVVALALEPTIHGSGLTVILEAMASGRPIVATDNPGLSDYITEGVTGLLVPPKDPDAMADAIAGLLADPDRAAELGREGRRRVVDRFTTAHMAEDIDAVLRVATS